MALLWTNLLFRYGDTFAWPFVQRSAQTRPPADPGATTRHGTVAAWRLPPLRLCLGIGDGQMRRQ